LPFASPLVGEAGERAFFARDGRGLSNMKNENIIIGLGKTGLSCAHFLTQQGKPFAIMDSRSAPPFLDTCKKLFPEAPIYLGNFDPLILNAAKTLIVSPGIPLQEKSIAGAIQQGVEAIGDVELFARHVTAPIIAITGSNAKSTVTTLVGELFKSVGLKVAVGGNLGTPVLELLMQPSPDYFILELSSFQLETTFSLAPQIATILNISVDHMDRYKALSDYILAKQRIYHKSHWQIINRGDTQTYPSTVLNPAHILSFGLDTPLENAFGLGTQANETWLYFGKTPLLSTQEMQIQGQHNWLNALAALAICHAASIPIFDALPALKNFRGLAHRCEFIAEHNNIRWYNDSKGTNVGAAVAALEGLGPMMAGKLIWIAGGIGKDADFTPLKTPVKKYVRKAALIGRDAKRIGETLQQDTEIIYADSLKNAVEIAHSAAHPQDAVVLSPACASFDMFENFEHRGNVFKRLVDEITHE
jgi:UDP-N-acetylmuramoylalanine--D-glutamate ligase